LRARTLISAALGTALTLPATAADCQLDRAVYTDAFGYALAFRPIAAEEELAVSNAFTLTLPGGGTTLEGLVSWGNGFTRPIGRLMFGCPAQPTYEDEQACTHWQGIVYGVDGSSVDLLRAGDEPAHEQVILANLGQVLNYSLFPMRVAEPIEEMPWDIFTFKECSP
jgi:hypothetical protein